MNILIVGVGGQGTLLASRVLGAWAVNQNKDCKLSEVHGMSQRGGSVVTHVRIGSDVASPVITEGQADYVIAFETLEAFRWMHYLSQNGTIILNEGQILPMPVIMGAADYPENIPQKIRDSGKNLVVLDAGALAEKAGNIKAVNIVMIGAFAKKCAISYDEMEDAMSSSTPARFLDVNKRALKYGYEPLDAD
ncbi:MAG: indolepyruvate oxidoreductase subunit beta [Christensenellaceae bacterium]|jgi:indolepyruvate ferredoxin oxidoreductase beta subunit|nr:indolepyruvate oxidoreductase subunit beta [Christensenellaceae bacterium]